eukprot:700372-Lingulodinium_polyedra.AAC.1
MTVRSCNAYPASWAKIWRSPSTRSRSCFSARVASPCAAPPAQHRRRTGRPGRIADRRSTHARR